MLTITIPDREFWDEQKQEFVNVKGQTIQLEHSLVSLSKWESKWNKPFLSQKDKTFDETLDYIRCMTVTKNVKPEVYYGLTMDNVDAINRYIDSPMTATTFNDGKKGSLFRETITSEIIYYWMIALDIPFECQKWHLNRLITLIRVCQIKTQPAKKMSKEEIMRRNAELNAARRKALHTTG